MSSRKTSTVNNVLCALMIWFSLSLSFSAGDLISDPVRSLPSEQATEISLWERFGKAAMLDIESNSFSWDMLSSLHHTEHGSSTEQSEDEMNKALEVWDSSKL